MPDILHQILYISQSTRQFSTEDCENILLASHQNNKRDGITSFLAYLPNGTIIQILEGLPDALNATYERISNDRRHHSISKIIDTENDERLFGEWLMGFRMLEESEVRMLPDFVNLREGEIPELLDGTPATIKVMKTIFAVNSASDYA